MSGRYALLGVILIVGVALAQGIIVSVSPSNYWFLPGQVKGFDLKVENNYTQSFNATVYVESLNTSFLLVNNTKMLRVDIVKWGAGQQFTIPFNITVSNNTLLGATSLFEVLVYNDTSTGNNEILRKYYTIQNVYPTDLEYKFTASKTNVSELDLTVIMTDNRNSNAFGTNETRGMFESWANVTTLNGTEVASNHSDGLSLNLNLTGRIGEYVLNFGVYYKANPRYKVEKKVDVLLLYSLNFTNVSASYLGPVNAYYPLKGPISGGTLVCVQGRVMYDNEIPLDEYPNYNLTLKILNNVITLTTIKGQFTKCFNAPTENGNFSITLMVIGENGLSAKYIIPIEINNMINYKTNNTEVISNKISGEVQGNTLLIRNNNTFDIYGKIYAHEVGSYHHFNFSVFNGKSVDLASNGITQVPLDFIFPPWTPPGNYKIVFTITTASGNITFPALYTVKTEATPGSIAYARYYDTNGNDTRVVIYIQNTYDQPAAGTIKETIPKSVVKSLNFIIPDKSTESMARDCSKTNNTISCIRDVALKTGDCGICTTETCWEICIQERLYSNRTFNKTYPIIFMKKPKIINPDPVVSWNVNVSADSSTKIVYIIRGEQVNVSKFPNLVGSFTIVKNKGSNSTNKGNNTNNSTPVTNGTEVVYGLSNQGSSSWVWLIILVLVIGLGGGAYWWFKIREKQILAKTQTKMNEKGNNQKKENEGKADEEKKEESTKKPTASEDKEKEKKEPSPDDAFNAIGGGFV